MKTKKLFLALLLLSVCGAIIMGRKLFAALTEYKAGEEIYENISSAAHSVPTDEPSEPVNSEITEITVRNEIIDSTQEPEPSVSAIDFDVLLDISPDVKGWIRLEGTKVDYPVVQCKDNDFYLNRAVTGDWNKVGTPFIDFRNSGDFSDPLTVIYGHYMGDGSMFTAFHDYKSQKFYEEHPFIALYTPGGDYRILPVAGVFQNVEYWDFTFDYGSDEALMRQINSWKALSTFKSETGYDADDRFVVLTLCTYDVENSRFLLVGKLEEFVY